MSSILFILITSPADTYFFNQNYTQADRYYRAMSVITPSFRNNYQAALCALIEGRTRESIELFNSLPARSPYIFYYLGVGYYQLGLLKQAKLNFNKALQIGIRSEECNYYLGLIALKNNDITRALEHFEEISITSHNQVIMEYIDDYNRLVAAQKKYLTHDYKAMLELYDRVEYFPDFKELGQAFALFKLKQYAECLRLLDSVLARIDNRNLLSTGFLLKARIYIKLDKNLMARKYLLKCRTIEHTPDIDYLIGLTFSNEANYDSARYYFQELPDTVDAYLFYKGRTNYFLGLWGRAEEILLRQRELFPDSPYGDRAVYILASINFRRKEYNYAIEFWQELLDLYPSSIYAAAAQKGIGDAYFNSKQYARAYEAYRKVEHYEPSPGIKEQTALKLYETLYKLKKFPSFIAALHKFIEEFPDYRLALKTRLRIAQILFKKKQYYQSLAELNKILERYPDSGVVVEALVEKARVYQALGKKKELKKVYKSVLENKYAGSYYAYAANELALLYFEEMNYDTAIYYYNYLLDYEQYKEKALLEIAHIYDLLGQPNEAETIIDRLISEFPSSRYLIDAYLLKAKVYKIRDDYQKAIELLEKLIEETGDNPEIYMEIGNLYFEHEDYLDARRSYLLACKYFKQRRNDAAQALILAGDASLAIGDIEDARQSFLQANLIAESITLKNQASARIAGLGRE